MFQTRQFVPTDVALNDMRHIPIEEHQTLIHLHNLNLHDQEDFDDTDDDLADLEAVELDVVMVDFSDCIDFDPIFD